MQTETKKAIAKMIEATFTVTSQQEFLKVNISSTSITPEPTQEVINLRFNVVGRHAIGGFRSPAYGLLLAVRALAAGCRTTHRLTSRPLRIFNGHDPKGGKVPLCASLTTSRVSGSAGPAHGVFFKHNLL